MEQHDTVAKGRGAMPCSTGVLAALGLCARRGGRGRGGIIVSVHTVDRCMTGWLVVGRRGSSCGSWRKRIKPSGEAGSGRGGAAFAALPPFCLHLRERPNLHLQGASSPHTAQAMQHCSHTGLPVTVACGAVCVNALRAMQGGPSALLRFCGQQAHGSSIRCAAIALSLPGWDAPHTQQEHPSLPSSTMARPATQIARHPAVGVW